MKENLDRRGFLKHIAAGGAAAAFGVPEVAHGESTEAHEETAEHSPETGLESTRQIVELFVETLVKTIGAPKDGVLPGDSETLMAANDAFVIKFSRARGIVPENMHPPAAEGILAFGRAWRTAMRLGAHQNVLRFLESQIEIAEDVVWAGDSTSDNPSSILPDKREA